MTVHEAIDEVQKVGTIRAENGKLKLRFPETERARLEAAIEALRHAIRLTPPDRVVLRPGSLLLFHNLRNLHGRSAFSGRRWLQRIYSRKSLAALQKNSGVAGPVFPVVSVMLRS